MFAHCLMAPVAYVRTIFFPFLFLLFFPVLLFFHIRLCPSPRSCFPLLRRPLLPRLSRLVSLLYPIGSFSLIAVMDQATSCPSTEIPWVAPCLPDCPACFLACLLACLRILTHHWVNGLAAPLGKPHRHAGFGDSVRVVVLCCIFARPHQN